MPYRTAWENTFLACELRGIPVDNIQKQAAKEILDLFNIETEALNKFPKELSGGMKQRIGLLQTLLTDASLFLLDEPFNAIDINALNSIKLYIWEYLIKSNKTMIFITHNIDQALLLSDRILIMQTSHKQWYFGKNLDDFTPIGPWIVTKNEFENPPALSIRSYVNGELRQDSNTSLMINGVAKVISQLSQGMTLQAGTIIAMGTPAGVGMGFEPPKFLKAGDVVTCEIEGIGKLTNEVK